MFRTSRTRMSAGWRFRSRGARYLLARYSASDRSAPARSSLAQPVRTLRVPSRMTQVACRTSLPRASRSSDSSHRRAPLLRRGIAPSFVRYWPALCNPCRRYARSQGGPGPLHGVIHWQSSSRRGRQAWPPRPAEGADRGQYPHAGDTCSPFVGIPWHFQASTLGVDTSIPIGRSKCRRLVSTPLGLFLLGILGVRSGQPDVSNLTELPDRDKLFLFSPVECSLELGIPKLPLLLGSALRRRAGVEVFANQLLIDHPHSWPIRRDRQVDPLLGQNCHQHSLQPQHRRALILPAGLRPKVGLRRRLGRRSGRQPIHHHGRNRIPVLVLLRRLDQPQAEGVLLPLPATSVLAHSQPGIGDAATKLLISQAR